MLTDRVIFGAFSGAHPDFTFSNQVSDVNKFKTENRNFETLPQVSFSALTQAHLTSFMQQELGYDNVLENLRIRKFRNFSNSVIVSLRNVQPVLHDMPSFLKLSSVPNVEPEDLKRMQDEIALLHQGALEALEKHGDQACLMIW